MSSNLYINLFERHHFVPASNEGHENNGINLSSLFFPEDEGGRIDDDSDIISKVGTSSQGKFRKLDSSKLKLKII